MLGLSGKTGGFGLNHIPKRSTLSDTNKKRNVLVLKIFIMGYSSNMEFFCRTAELKTLSVNRLKSFTASAYLKKC